MAYRAGKTGVAQTAANVAATRVAAEVQAGLIGSTEEADTRFQVISEAVMKELEPIVAEDNAVYEAAEAAAPKRSGGGGGYQKSGGGSGGGSITAESARGVDLTFGKFKGCTLGELETMTADEAEAYKPGNGPGIKYIEWLSKNEQNAFMAKRAKAILDDRKASSDE